MANWSNPQLTSTYTNFVTEVKDRDVDLALQFDGTTSTNLPTGTIRWSSSANRWQKWSGSSWGELTNTYQLPNITISGVTNAGTLLAGTADITAEITCGRVDVDSSSVAVNGMYLPSTNTLGFATGGTAHYYIDSSGNLLYGRSTARTDVSGRLQLEGTGAVVPDLLIARNNSLGANGPNINLVRNSANSTTNTALGLAHVLGRVRFYGSDGTSYAVGATIQAYSASAWSVGSSPTTVEVLNSGGKIVLTSTGNFELFNNTSSNTPVNLNGSAPNNALVLDASGNLGLGVTPSTWSVGKAIEIGQLGNALFGATSSQLNLMQNATYNGAFKYVNAAAASYYQQLLGAHNWFTSTGAPSAGGNITFTQAMTLNASGNLLLGTTTDGPFSRNLLLNGSSSAGILFRVGDVTKGFVYADSTDTYLGAQTGAVVFKPADNERARIDSSGRLLVGATSDSGGALLQVNGDRIRVATAKTPASATAAGTAGEVCWDTNYIYVCTATNTWKRAAIATW